MRADAYDEAARRSSANPYANGVAIFTRDGAPPAGSSSEVDVGMVGVNVPIPVPMAFYSFGGWKRVLFGDTPRARPRRRPLLHARKVVTTRWADPHTRGPDLGFPTHT